MKKLLLIIGVVLSGTGLAQSAHYPQSPCYYAAAGTYVQCIMPYTLNWPAAQGGASSVLQNDGSGNLSWAAGGSGGASIGSPVGGGTTGSVLFVKSGPVLGQDNANFFWDAINHRLGIGTTTPGFDVDIEHNVGPGILVTTGYGTGNSGLVVTRNARGTLASPTAVQSGDVIGGHNFRGYGATDFQSSSSARINGMATQNWTDTNQGAAITFSTTPNNSTPTSIAERMRIDQNGTVGIGTTIPGAALTVQDTNNNDTVYFYTNSTSQYADNVFFDASNAAHLAIGFGNSAVGQSVFRSTNFIENVNTPLVIASGSDGTTNSLYMTPVGNFGFGGITTPANAVDIKGALAIGSYAGNNTAPSNSLIISGNVGVGSSNPAHPLVVSSTDNIATIKAINTSSASQSGFVAYNDLNSNVRIAEFGYSGSTSGTQVTGGVSGEQGFQGTVGNFPFTFYTNTNARMTILGNGKIGIGTSAPVNVLDLNGAMAMGSYAGVNTAPTSGLIVSGNVGIGTNNPGTNALQVNGTFHLGSAGTSMTSQGICVVTSSVLSTTATDLTCTGVPATTSVAVHCSTTSSMSTTTGNGVYCQAQGTASTITCNTILANTNSVALYCGWMQ